MGLAIGFSSGSSDYKSCACGDMTVNNYIQMVNSKNPDPKRFSVMASEVVNGHAILLVNYPNCTTFGGNKLLLLRGKKYNKNKLDPHLLGNNHCVMARFEPNKQGYKLARICAENL